MRKLAGLAVMILVALLLAACGNDDDGEATEVATTAVETATEAATEEATGTAAVEETAAIETVAAAAESSPAASAVPIRMATPAAEPPAASTPAMATPVVTSPAAASPAPASPVAASPVAATPAVMPLVAATDPAATPVAAEIALSGTVELAGTANEAWVMTDVGCVGLGARADLKAGRQLVVRDATGTIVGVTTLEASDETDTCAWTFSLTVPASAFYEVSVPMAVEHVFTRQEVEQRGGEIVVPIT